MVLMTPSPAIPTPATDPTYSLSLLTGPTCFISSVQSIGSGKGLRIPMMRGGDKEEEEEEEEGG